MADSGTRSNMTDDAAGRTTGQRIVVFVMAVVVLAIAHVFLMRYWSDWTGTAWREGYVADPMTWPLNGAWFGANVFVAASALLTGRRVTSRRLIGWLAGYAAILWLYWPSLVSMPENVLFLSLMLLAYGALLHHPRWAGYLFVFLLCLRFAPAYLYPAFALTSLLYTTLPPFVRAWWREKQRFVPLCHLAGLILLLGLLMPVVFFCTQSAPQTIQQRLREADVLAALAVSLRTSAIATLIVLALGVPLAYAIVRRAFPGRGLIDALIDLPIVVPPPIVGIILLTFLGPMSPLGAYVEHRFGIKFYDSEWGIVVAQVFVGSPYLIRASMVAFASVDVRYEHVARTLGASQISAFARITLPLSLRGILIGAILTWFRAMAEFGALRVLAQSPRTIPILTYDRYSEIRQAEAHSVGVLIVLLCLCVVVGMWIIRSMPSILGKSIGASDASR